MYKCQVSCMFSKKYPGCYGANTELTLPRASGDIPCSGQRTINYQSTHMILVKTCSCQAAPGFFHPQSLLILLLSWLQMIGDLFCSISSFSLHRTQINSLTKSLPEPRIRKSQSALYNAVCTGRNHTVLIKGPHGSTNIYYLASQQRKIDITNFQNFPINYKASVAFCNWMELELNLNKQSF